MIDENQNKAAVKALNELLERNYDAEKGYLKAAEDIQNSLLEGFFKENSTQRYHFGHELKEEILAMGGKPEKGSSLTADLHRTWIDVKSILTGKDTEAVVKEVIRGETTALEDYEDALRDQKFGPKTREVVLRQHDSIQDVINRLNQLEKSVKA